MLILNNTKGITTLLEYYEREINEEQLNWNQKKLRLNIRNIIRLEKRPIIYFNEENVAFIELEGLDCWYFR